MFSNNSHPASNSPRAIINPFHSKQSKDALSLNDLIAPSMIRMLGAALAEALMAGKAVPETEPRDAAHIALAAVHGLTYLVTWNFKHILNPHLQLRIGDICRDAAFIPATICTPEQLLESYDDA